MSTEEQVGSTIRAESLTSPYAPRPGGGEHGAERTGGPPTWDGERSRISTGSRGSVSGVEILLVIVGAEGVRLVEEVDGVIVDRLSGAPVDVLEGVLVGVELETETAPAA